MKNMEKEEVNKRIEELLAKFHTYDNKCVIALEKGNKSTLRYYQNRKKELEEELTELYKLI